VGQTTAAQDTLEGVGYDDRILWPKTGSDAENNMVYAQDLVGKVAGMKLDPATGQMKTVFVVDDRTTCLVALIGPKDKRVIMTSNQHYDVPFEPMMLALGTGFYKEQVRWRDAATGRLIAEFRPRGADVDQCSRDAGFWWTRLLSDRQRICGLAT
jgi:hypothetical protein